VAKALPKINDIEKTPMKEVLGKDAAPKKGRGRPKKFQTLAEVEADINLREYQKLKKKFDKLKASKKAKITPAKISPTFYPLDAGLKLEEETKVQTEKITKIISIQKLHRQNHQKEKSEIVEINNVLTGIADFIKADYESRVDAVDKANDQMRDDAAKEDQAKKEKGLEATNKKTGDKIGKTAQNIVSPVKGVFQRLMDAVTAIGLGIGASAAFKFLARPEIFEKLTGVFDFIGKHFKWVLGALGAIALIGIVAPIIGIASAIGTVIAAIAGAAVIVAKIALIIGGIILAIKGATDVFKWLRGDMLGDSKVSDARKENRDMIKEQGVEKAHISGIFGERYRVERDGEMVKLKYKELTPDEQAIVDQFKARDQEIKDFTKERNNEKKKERKRIVAERKETEEFKDIQAMSSRGGAGIKKREALAAFDQETDRLVKERHDEIEAEFEKKLNYRKVGGDASGLTMVGENGPEIVDFKTAVNVVPAHRTQETLKTLSESGGTNVVTMDLPPITTPAPEVNIGTPPANTEQDIPSINPFNTYMVLTPQLLKIS
jgi:hypothetical protein